MKSQNRSITIRTMSQVETFQELLKRVPAFRNLQPQDLAWLSEQARPFACPTGQELLSADHEPDFIYAIVQGRGRVLHHDPGVRRPLTLAISHPGDLVGWAAIARNHQLIGLPAEAFRELINRSDALRSWLESTSTPAELIQCLEPSLRRRPKAEPDEREVLRQLLPHIQVVSRQTPFTLPDDRAVWLWNCAPRDSNTAIGERVEPSQLAELPSGQSLRLLRVDPDAWHRHVESEQRPAEAEVLNPLQTPWQNDRYADLAAPEPREGDVADEGGTANLGRLSQLPVFTGVGPVEQTMACLQMLAAFFSMPFRADILERLTREQLGNRAPSLPTLAALSSFMGLNSTMLDLPAGQLHLSLIHI